MRNPVDEPITVPPEPVAGPPSPFPIVASVAPVVASLVIWFFTRSPFVLAFAALGPIIAVASIVDSRWSSRRRLRAETVRYRKDLDRLAAEIGRRHEEERRLRRAALPGARGILDATDSPEIGFGRWRAPADNRRRVIVGFGDEVSAVRVDGPPGEATTRLRHRASVVSDVPVEVDATGGIGVVGPAVLGRAFARGLLVQLCNAASPEALVLAEAPPGWEWTVLLPHRREDPDVRCVRIIDAGDVPPAPIDIPIVLARRLDRIPSRCSSVLEITGVRTALLHRTTADGHPEAVSVTIDLVSDAEASRFASTLSGLAVSTGLETGKALPLTVGFREVSSRAAPAREGSLSAVVGADNAGPVLVDLVSDGPHAIVGGTTGSGKSELLVTWVTSIAERCAPTRVTFLLVDFKGGAAFAPLVDLPHVVGILTDLDGGSASRALESLRAEVRYRERRLRELGARDIAGAPALARLVIVVDEFAAMLDGFPDLHALFVDIAARGRSLGLHLILCTQRPAGVVRDSLLANCGLRMSLRVNNRADSTAILGTDAAANLPVSHPGRLVLAGPDASVTLQVAATTGHDLAQVARRWPRDSAPRRPWLDPLPPLVRLADLADLPDGIRLGLADHPAEQRQDVAAWHPSDDGSLLVVGMARTGKTTILDTISAEAMRVGRWIVERIGPDPELAWDVIHDLVTTLNRPADDGHGVLLLVDDLDSLLAGLDADDAIALRDGVLTLLRDGPRCGVFVVVSVQRVAGPTAVLASFVGSTVLLGTANRQEHLLAGGDSATWLENRRAGSAAWRGVDVQLCASDPSALSSPKHAASRTVTPFDWRAHPATVVVSNQPGRRVDEIRARNAAEPSLVPVRVAALSEVSSGRITVDEVSRHSDGPVVIVGDLEHWQSHWPLLTALRERAVLVLDGCSATEFRAVTRTRSRPPVLARLSGRAWSCAPDGTVCRVSLPPPPDPA